MSYLNVFYMSIMNKSDVDLLTGLKVEIDNAINFFSKINNITVDDIDSLEDTGYALLYKVKSYLMLLELKDENQTNKYDYAKCLTEQCIDSPQQIYNLGICIKKLISDANIDNVLHKAKVNKKDVEVQATLGKELEEQHIKRINIISKDLLLAFINFINSTLLSLIKIKEITKKTYISYNNY